MYHNARRAATLAALLLVSAAACGKNDAEEAATTTADAGTIAPASNLSIGDVKLGKEIDANKRVTNESDDFKAADVIYASVETKGAASNASITARWTYEDGQLVDSLTQVISPSGDAATEFHISKPGGLPTGKYKLTILLNGAEVSSEDFEIEK